ncbi:acyl-CoA dehydrogenase family protein [Paracoccus albus]|uniref:acyl-CoA dehydrogenase family protein n=1 Tax=Paracoccus albus TaxID=3017784 RepID=UPI0022F0071F|nr:acyl-CoA dehydrogenase family protein [Paracoccus albus]WBU59225.1 acyl-CoA dehydrogenase family protein [Paracoccus albus]
MDFNLSEDHQMLSDTLRRFLADNYEIETRNEAAYTAPYHSPEMWESLAGLGTVGAFITEETGGFGGTAEDVSVVFEEMGRALSAEPMLGALMGLRLLADFGQDKIVEAIVGGEARCALAVYEPRVAFDLDHIEATARQDGDQWKLQGRKSAIYGAPGADHVLVVARTDQGLGVFLTTTPPLISAAMIDGGGIADLVMDDLAAECLSADARTQIEDALDLGRIALCAEAVGAASHLIDLTVDYMKQRQQFGRSISSFQALQHRVVDMLVDLEQARSITIAAVAAFGTPDQARKVSMAKNLIGRAGRHISEEAIQLHGGIGMTWEYPGAHYAKRLVMIDHQLGDRTDHLQRIILPTDEASDGQ